MSVPRELGHRSTSLCTAPLNQQMTHFGQNGCHVISLDGKQLIGRNSTAIHFARVSHARMWEAVMNSAVLRSRIRFESGSIFVLPSVLYLACFCERCEISGRLSLTGLHPRCNCCRLTGGLHISMVLVTSLYQSSLSEHWLVSTFPKHMHMGLKYSFCF